eukprot:3185163-Prymnesium_polylepis.1
MDDWGGGSLGDVLARSQPRRSAAPESVLPPTPDGGEHPATTASRRHLAAADPAFTAGLGDVCPPRPQIPLQRPVPPPPARTTSPERPRDGTQPPPQPSPPPEFGAFGGSLAD